MSKYLKVLNMTVGEQQIWWQDAYWEEEASLGAIRECSMSTAAFRLRDEVCVDHLGCDAYHRALKKVFYYRRRGTPLNYEAWLENLIEPIDRIIAALIAKEAKDGE